MILPAFLARYGRASVCCLISSAAISSSLSFTLLVAFRNTLLSMMRPCSAGRTFAGQLRRALMGLNRSPQAFMYSMMAFSASAAVADLAGAALALWTTSRKYFFADSYAASTLATSVSLAVASMMGI